MLRWRRGTTQQGRSWLSPCSARSTSSQGSAASTGQLTIKISSRTTQLFWPRGICHSRETFHIHNCEGQIHQEIFWLVSLLWSVKPKWSSSSSYISMKMWRDVVDVSCRNPYAKLFLLPDRRSSSQSTHLFSLPFLFFSLTPCKNFQWAEQAANENSGEHKPPAVEPELRLLKRASRRAAPTSAWSYGLGLW